MHLKYPHTSKFFTWEELSCLTSALGFPHGTLRKCIPEDHMIRGDGVSYREMLKLIDMKYFNEALHLSVNMHTADYNINALRKSMNLLNHRFLSFDELSDVRVAYQVYEAGDMKGMVIDKHTLMRTLKLCGRTVAPLKLMHRVKHMEERLDESGRIQFYEFLDLIVLCTHTKDVDIPHSRCGPLDKTWRKLFQLDDFEKVFSPHDERLEEHLNRAFIGSERNYGHEILGSKRIPRESSVDPSTRKTQVRFHTRRYKELKNSLNQSTGQVQQTKAGHVRARPISAPDDPQFGVPGMSPIFDKRPHTVAEIPTSAPPSPYLPLSRPISARSETRQSELESVRNVDPRLKLLQAIHDRKTLQSAPPRLDAPGLKFKPPPSVRCTTTEHQSATGSVDVSTRPWKRKVKPLTRPETSQVVMDTDVRDRQHVLDSLQYEIETLEERTMQRLRDRLRHFLPHHQFKSAAIKKQEADELERARVAQIEEEKLRRKKRREAKKAATEALDRLVHPEPRAYLALHDRTCDSRSQAFGMPCHGGDARSHRTKATPKPVVLLDGHRVIGDGSEPSLRINKNIVTSDISSTGSVDDSSSIAQTTDISHHPTPSMLAQVRHNRATNHPYDPMKFHESRMGTAAILHNYFHDNETGSECQNDVTKMAAAVCAKTENINQGEGNKEDEKTEREVGLEHLRKTSMKAENEKLKSRKPANQHRSPALQNANWERTKLTRKVKVGEDDELWLHGFPLSEIDRLTFNSEEGQVGDLDQLSQSLSDV